MPVPMPVIGTIDTSIATTKTTQKTRHFQAPVSMVSMLPVPPPPGAIRTPPPAGGQEALRHRHHPANPADKRLLLPLAMPVVIPVAMVPMADIVTKEVWWSGWVVPPEVLTTGGIVSRTTAWTTRRRGPYECRRSVTGGQGSG